MDGIGSRSKPPGITPLDTTKEVRLNWAQIAKDYREGIRHCNSLISMLDTQVELLVPYLQRGFSFEPSPEMIHNSVQCAGRLLERTKILGQFLPRLDHLSSDFIRKGTSAVEKTNLVLPSKRQKRSEEEDYNKSRKEAETTLQRKRGELLETSEYFSGFRE